MKRWAARSNNLDLPIERASDGRRTSARPSSTAFSGRFGLMSYELGIIGAGQMAEAIVRGLLRSGLYGPEQLIAADVAQARRDLFSEDLRIRAVESNAEVARQSKTL